MENLRAALDWCATGLSSRARGERSVLPRSSQASPTTPPATKQADRAKPGAHESLQPSQCDSCSHTLVIHNGAVHDSTLTAKGTLTIGEPLTRQQVRRYHRGSRAPGYRFTLGVTVPCAKGAFVAWISPHPQADDTTHRRPDQMRLIPPNDPDFATLYGLRNDSESINNKFKNTLPHKRAASLGWKRQLLDLIAWSLLTNTYAWHQHRSTSPMERSA